MSNTIRRIGDSWLMSHTSALLRVPSVLVPETWNTRINPRHPDSQRLRIIKTIATSSDGRLR